MVYILAYIFCHLPFIFIFTFFGRNNRDWSVLLVITYMQAEIKMSVILIPISIKQNMAHYLQHFSL